MIIDANFFFVSDPEMSLDIKTVSAKEVSLILGHVLHYRMEPSLFITILPYMNNVLSNARSKISLYSYIYSMNRIIPWDIKPGTHA